MNREAFTLKLRGRPVPKGRPRAGIAGGWAKWRPHKLLPALRNMLIELDMMVQANSPAEEFKQLVIKQADALQAVHNLPSGYPKTFVYTPTTTRDYEKLVALQSKQIQTEMLTGELAVEMWLLFNKRNFGDIDNYSKSVLDALQNARAYLNDKQIADLHVKRRYEAGQAEQTIVRVSEIIADEQTELF